MIQQPRFPPADFPPPVFVPPAGRETVFGGFDAPAAPLFIWPVSVAGRPVIARFVVVFFEGFVVFETTVAPPRAWPFDVFGFDEDLGIMFAFPAIGITP